MNYPQAIRYLESFRSRGIVLGLDRVRSILSELGDPQETFASIHIAGTNGKGSVAAMLSSILTKTGNKTGLYTSPHLVDYTERVRINERDISKTKFAGAVEEVKRAIERLPRIKLTEFEVLTAAAFLMLKHEKIDIAVIEVGLGGRLDATNVIAPILSIITNIDLDHIDILGNSITNIAKEKAGIIKPGIPVITGATKGLSVISSICKQKGSKLIKARQGCSIMAPLEGEHQKKNLAIVAAAVDQLRKLGYRIGREELAEGLRSTKWPGRLQIVSKKPLMILDGAHNVAGAKALKAYLSKLGKKITLIIGMQSNKDIKGYIKVIKDIADHFYVVRSSNPGAASKLELAKAIGSKAILAKDIRSALKEAKAQKKPICVTGSLYLVGDYLKQRARGARRVRRAYSKLLFLF